jgi:hypothetical protein
MLPRRLPDGRLRVPESHTLPDGTILDGSRVIGPDDPDYAKWDRWMREHDPRENEDHAPADDADR